MVLEESIVNNKCYNYDESIVKTFGLPRYDNLKDNSKKQILIIEVLKLKENGLTIKFCENIKYYALEKNGKRFNELSQIGKILKYKSFKHKLMYLHADKIISSHPYQSVINPFFEYDKITNMFYNGLITSKIYFLQHGVTLGNISGWLSKFDKDKNT